MPENKNLYCYHCFNKIDPDIIGDYCAECGKKHSVHYSQSEELPAGTYLNNGRYFVGESIGSGGFGITYIGFDTKLEKKILIKETFYNGLFKRNVNNKDNPEPLKVTYGKDFSLERIMQKTKKECKGLSEAEGLNNIVKVYDWFSENNTAYIITEFINGVTLDERVRQKGYYSWEELYKKLKPLMQSLSVLHEKGIIHRDIKPQNIMIKNIKGVEEEFVLIDFGLARSTENKTLSSTGIGFTPGYSPYEQRSFLMKDGIYTDVYSLAATICFALTGVNPNVDMADTVEGNFPIINKLNSEYNVARNVVKALNGALVLDYRKRCKNISELIRLFEKNDRNRENLISDKKTKEKNTFNNLNSQNTNIKKSPIDNTHNNTIKSENIQKKTAVKSFFTSVTGKITAVVLMAVVISGTVAGAAIVNGFGKTKRDFDDNTTSKFQSDSDKNTSRVYDVAIDNLPNDGSVVVPNDKYQDLVAGNLTKEQLEFVLARLPDNFDASTDNTSIDDYINMFCSDIINKGSENGFTSPTNIYFYPDFKVDEVNNILASFKDYEITQENYNIGNGEYLALESGDIITLDVTMNSTQANAVIEIANYNDIEMKVTFYSELYSDSVDYRMRKQAILTAGNDKKYRITKIEIIDDNVDTDNSLKPEPQHEPTVSSEESSGLNSNNTDGDTDKSSMTSSSTSSEQTQSQSTTTVVVPPQQDNTTHTSPSENNNNFRQEEEKLEDSVELNDDEYSSKIRGELTKEQLELVLSWIDNQYCDNKVNDSNVMIVLNYLADDIRNNGKRSLTYNGDDSNYRMILNAKEMNNLLSSFSNYDIFNSSLFAVQTEYGSYIDGEDLHLSVKTPDNKASINANITKAEYNNDEMWIHYSSAEGDRTAILKKQSDGKYFIIEVTLY